MPAPRRLFELAKEGGGASNRDIGTEQAMKWLSQLQVKQPNYREQTLTLFGFQNNLGFGSCSTIAMRNSNFIVQKDH